MKVRVKVRGGEVEGKGEGKKRVVEVGRLKEQGREKEGKGKVKVITLISAVSVRFETVPKYEKNGKR